MSPIHVLTSSKVIILLVFLPPLRENIGRHLSWKRNVFVLVEIQRVFIALFLAQWLALHHCSTCLRKRTRARLVVSIVSGNESGCSVTGVVLKHFGGILELNTAIIAEG